MSEMYDNDQRASFFKRNDDLEIALTDLNNLISTVNCEVEFSQPERPIVLLMGCPRAGSTLMLQWLASLGVFSYPSNLIARFYKNPFIGIRAQQSLLELDPLNQLGFTKSWGLGLVGCLVHTNLVVWLAASDLIWMINLS